jgi:DNA-binding beta-propeller fold protein YncE
MQSLLSRFSRCCAHLSAITAAAITLIVPLPARAETAFTAFESGHVRPMTMSPDGKWLYVTNTPDNRLEIFRILPQRLQYRASVSVGLEPVAVAARNDDEVWVVNHLSDSVSVVDVSAPAKAHVVRTLLVGDEPRDIVFAGADGSRAFITTAHRGQNSPIDPQFSTPGVGRADVWVFDACALGDSLGGDPLTILTLFSDTPRALAVTPDKTRVYAAAFHSGNRTTSITGGFLPPLPPVTSFEGVPTSIAAGIVLQFNGTDWVDATGTPWNGLVNFSLPDKDVFVIDATANPPAQASGAAGYFTGVGTILFNMIVNPVNGKVYVANTEASNLDRLEGPGIFAGHSLRGHLHESRITVLGPAGVQPRHLNKHIDYGTCCAPVPNPENARSLAFPQGMAISGDGNTLYVAALGSGKIGVFNTAELEDDTFVPNEANHIPVSGGGPTGLVLDEQRHRLYALTRFDNSISVLNTQTRTEIAHIAMHNPEPPSVVQGRRFLYDAASTSSHGDSACASCHVFGDFDSLAWDLGNPDASVITNPGPFVPDPADAAELHFVPLKGAMTTQSLRGMANHGPMHWRGDRTGGNAEPNAQPDGGAFDEVAAFMEFRRAFVDLLGLDAPLSVTDMQAFADFSLQITYPPNPIRNLDNVLTPQQQAGRDQYFGSASFFGNNCNSCHRLDPDGNPGSAAPGFFGTDGSQSFNAGTQMLKAPQMRNLYQKVGMFGYPVAPFLFPDTDFSFMGDQVRGFGYFHDGSVDTLFRFLNVFEFQQSPDNPEGFPIGSVGVTMRQQIEAFLLAFDTNLAPIVGQQMTLTKTNSAVVGSRLNLLEARADVGECDLAAKLRIQGDEVGFLYTGAGQFATDIAGAPSISSAALRVLVTSGGPADKALTYTCAPPGSGVRVALDRDQDGYLDGDERAAGSDPASAASTP